MSLHYRVVHYTSVGTSIPRNYLKMAAQCSANPRFCPEWLPQSVAGDDVAVLDECLNVPPGAPREYECLKTLSSWSELHERILHFVAEDPRRASAELNAAMPWLSEPRYYADKVYLYTTETGMGQLAGLVLKRYLEDKIYRGQPGRVEARIVSGFHESLLHGLSRLYEIVGDDIRAERNRDRSTIHLLNLTGGFKIEAAYMMLVGLKSALDRGFALYIHEAQKKPMIVPFALAFSSIAPEALRGLEEARQGRPVSASRCGGLLLIIAYIAVPLGLARIEDGLVFLNRDLVRLLELFSSEA